MKTILIEGKNFILRYDKSEEVLSQLVQFCIQHNIKAATFSGIGAAGELLLSYYDLEIKIYEDHQIKENVEIVSLTGNVAMLNGQHVIHAHGVFGKRDLSTIGGHVKKLIVSATCELVMQKMDQQLERQKDETIGLNLLR